MILNCCFQANWALAQLFRAGNAHLLIISIKLQIESL